MHATFYSTLAITAWLATAYRLWSLRRHPATPARHAVVAALGLLALTFTVSVPAVWVLLDRITGVNNIAALIAHLCVVGFAAVIELLLIWWASPPDRTAARRARLRLRALAVVVVLLLGLFVLAGPFESRQTDFVATYAGRPAFTVYLLTYLAAFSTGLVDIVRLCWPYSGLVGRGPLRLGLRVAAVGAAIGLIYCTARALDIIGVAAGWDVRRWEFVIPLSSSTGALLVIIGLTMPAWVPRLSGWARALRGQHQLYPLWKAIAEAAPEVRLTSRRSPFRIQARLHRRVVEIYDGRLVLRPYLDSAVSAEARTRGAAAGLTGVDLDAMVEAAKLTAALARIATGTKPDQPEAPVVRESPADELDEVAQLVRVARAFVHCPIVASYAQHASDGVTEPVIPPVRRAQ